MVYQTGSITAFRFFLMKKSAGFYIPAESFWLMKSGLGRSSYRAGFGAGTAFNAGIRVDLKFAVAFTDGGNGALSGAGTAADTFIRNLVSHGSLPPKTTIVADS